MEELRNDLERAVFNAISPVLDPEIGITLMELGLIYDVKVDENGIANIKMTLTSMACPAGPMLKNEIADAALTVKDVKEVEVELVWSPPWDPRTMASEDAKMMLGIF